LRPRITPPGDKSISHRYAILAALADGVSRIDNFAPGRDCAATLACLSALGVRIDRRPEEGVEIHGRGLRGLVAASDPLDAANSGTTMRLLAGVLAAHPFRSVLVGDPSLSRRPMQRLATPLVAMGARVETSGGLPPIVIEGGDLTGIEYLSPTPSAQIKSAVLLAGLHARGRTSVREPAATRDHTERALPAFGAEVRVDRLTATIQGGQRLRAQRLAAPGDASSAAIWGAAAAALTGSHIELAGVGLNPTRTAWIDVLRRMGARVDVEVEDERAGEPIGVVHVWGEDRGEIVITPAETAALIDELPALAAVAAHGGALAVSGAGELRVKESDRISRLADGLRAFGAEVDEAPDGFHIRGRALRSASVDAAGDHRLAMAFTIAALGADGPSEIRGADVVAVSYPGFFAALDAVRA
jgi:3-phosphoshikimate 1-carboxyvinyltransferase